MNTPRSFWGGYGLLFVVGMGSLYVAKQKINDRRDKQFRPAARSIQDILDDDFDSSTVKPGFPEQEGRYQRKSEYEGAGNSYSSRKPGDKFN